MRFLLGRISLLFAIVLFPLTLNLPAQAPAPAKPAPAAVSRVESPADNPVADPKAQVVFGHARFTVLTPKLIRMEWSATGTFEDHASLVFINRRLPVPHFSQTVKTGENGKTLTLTTPALVLTYLDSGDGHFTADTLSIQLDMAGKLVVWRPSAVDTGNLKGTTRTLDGARGDQTREPIEDGLISRSGWTLVDDTTRPLFDSTDFRFADGAKSPWPWVMQRPATEKPESYTDWYFFGYGLNYREELGDFVRVAGRIPLPPRFAFGAWWSRYWAYSDQELDQLVKDFRLNSTPLDVLVIDMDWHINALQLQAVHETDQAGQRLGWTGYTWNKLLFPDPDQFLKRLHEDGLKATLNMHPAAGVQPWERAYPEMARAMGIDPATRKYVPFDITDKKFAANYMNLLHHPLEKQGIDFWWLDWQQQKTTNVPELNPTWWLNYVHFTDQQREGKRPLLFHRWGGLGNHRYEIGFSGDTISVWESLAFQPWFTATAANVGYAYWSHDIGGHMPANLDPELYTRWVQFGAFSPILRTHTTKDPGSERRIWAYDEPYSSLLRSAFKLRYSLEPYLYTEARRTYDTGVAFFHPLYYDWPGEDAAYTSRNEYMFGDELLVSPVTSPADKGTGLAKEQVWLPEGNWVEWPTGKHFAGPVTVERSFSLDQIPVYVKAGAIVPTQPEMLYTGQKPVDPLVVNLWPLAQGASSNYSVYEDSGASVEYQREAFARTPIKATQNGDTLRVEIGPVEGSYPGMMRTRSYQLRLPGDWPPAAVTVNGRTVAQGQTDGAKGWTFEGNTLTTVIPTAAFSTSEKVTIEVRRAPGLAEKRGDLDGFAGAIARLRGTYEALQQTYPVAPPPDALIDAWQTGNRLTYHPERAVDELRHFRETLPKAQEAVKAAGSAFTDKLNAWAKQMETNPLRPANMEAQKQSRTESMRQAEVLVEEAGK